MNQDILLCGVGGQGTVLASKLIAAAAMAEGNTVHSAETIGMAQRGGSVISHIRIGDAASSPLIPYGHADILIAFEPAEAYRLSQKLEIHYTPKHGSWLDIAEIELSALTVQCLLGVRIPSIDDLNRTLTAWYKNRNAAQKGVSWQFTSESARIKLKHLYPVIKF